MLNKIHISRDLFKIIENRNYNLLFSYSENSCFFNDCANIDVAH